MLVKTLHSSLFLFEQLLVSDLKQKKNNMSFYLFLVTKYYTFYRMKNEWEKKTGIDK